VRHRLIAAGLTALLAVSPVAAVPAQAAPLPAAVSCSGVWVVVDYGSLGGTSTKCANGYATGTKALRSAGFSVNIDNGFILKISDKPGNPDPNKAYWSYWHATRQADGSYSNWSYSGLGADAYHPSQGNAEGWRYQSLSEGKVAPRAGAPTAPAAEPTPTPTPTKASPTPTKKPSATTKASASASAPSSTKAASVTPSASSSSRPTEPTTATTEVAATEKGTVPISAASAATEVAAEAPSADAQPSSGSPTGTIAAGVAVLAAFGGLGSWWLVKGRRN